MKNLLYMALLALPVCAQTGLIVPNAGSTGTTLNKLAKLTGAPSTAVITGTSDTFGAIGVVVGGAGTTGSAIISQNGVAACIFDGATTAGHYVTLSSSTAGDCHDAGASPPSTQAIGFVMSTNGGGGTYNLLISNLPPSASGAGTVTSVGGACGITAGPVTSSGTLSGQEAVNSQSGTSYAILSTDCGKAIIGTSSASQAYSIAQAGTGGFSAGWFADLRSAGTGTITLTPTTSTINGASTLVLTSGQSARIVTDGTNYFAFLGAGAGGGGSGTVTSVICGANLTGGTITTSGTCASDKTINAQKFFGTTAPGSVSGNLPGDLFTDTTNHNEYVCNAPSGTSAPACTSVTAAGWLLVNSGAGVSDPCTATVTSTNVVTFFAAATSTNPCNLGGVPLKMTASITLTTSGTSNTDVVKIYFDPAAQQFIAGYSTSTTYTFSSIGMVQSGISAYPDGVIHLWTIPTTANAWGTVAVDISKINGTPVGVGYGLSGPFDPTSNLQTFAIDPQHTAGISVPVTLVDASSVTWAIGSNAFLASATWTFTTHGGSRTLNLTGMVAGGFYSVKFIQDGTGGENIVGGTGCTWNVINAGGTTIPNLSAVATSTDILAWYYDGTNCNANLGFKYGH